MPLSLLADQLVTDFKEPYTETKARHSQTARNGKGKGDRNIGNSERGVKMNSL